MQCTEKYFEADAFRTRAESVLLAAVPDSRTGGGLLALEGTVFYPEGGGQPADRGTLTLPDGTELAVTDVHEQDGILWHSVPSLPDTAVPGITVEEAIDWDWRFDKMQQHTGEHILSGILHRMFGAENVGFHIGAEAVRMDTSVPISAEGLRAAELEANRIVWQDVPVVITYPTPQELAALTYRSKKEIEGQVRIVTIPGADVCACCGTHTRTTGQVGQIKILTSENYKGGVRLSIVCGARALEAAQAMRARQADIGALLSAKADQTAVAVHRVYDEYTTLKFNHFGLCSQLFDALAAAVEPEQNAIRIVPGLDPAGLHRLAVRLSEATTGLCAALTPNDKGTGYCLAQAGGDVRALPKALHPALTEELPDDAALCLYAGLREEYADSRDARCLATRDIRLARRLVRDCLFRGHGAAFTLGLWGHVCAGEDRYIKPYKPRANLLLDTTHTYEVCLWRTVLDAMPADPALTATQARQLAALREKFAAFPALGTELVPQNSMLREFIGK